MGHWTGNISLMANHIEHGYLGTAKCVPLTLKRETEDGTVETILDLTLHVPVDHSQPEAARGGKKDETFYKVIEELREALAKIAEHHRSKDDVNAEAEAAV